MDCLRTSGSVDTGEWRDALRGSSRSPESLHRYHARKKDKSPKGDWRFFLQTVAGVDSESLEQVYGLEKT